MRRYKDDDSAESRLGDATVSFLLNWRETVSFCDSQCGETHLADPDWPISGREEVGQERGAFEIGFSVS